MLKSSWLNKRIHVISCSYCSSGGVYDARRVFLDLREAGEAYDKNRVEWIMRLNHIKAIRGYKAAKPFTSDHQSSRSIDFNASL